MSAATLTFPKPYVVFTAGQNAAGKSTVAEELNRLGLYLIDKDDPTLVGNIHTKELVERLAVTDPTADVYKHPDYKNKYRGETSGEIFGRAANTLQNQQSCVIDAPFGSEAKNADAIRIFDEQIRGGNVDLDFDILYLWFSTSRDVLKDRMEARNADRDQSKFRDWPHYISGIKPDFRPKFPHILVDTTSRSYEKMTDLAGEIITLLNNGVSSRVQLPSTANMTLETL